MSKKRKIITGICVGLVIVAFVFVFLQAPLHPYTGTIQEVSEGGKYLYINPDTPGPTKLSLETGNFPTSCVKNGKVQFTGKWYVDDSFFYQLYDRFLLDSQVISSIKCSS